MKKMEKIQLTQQEIWQACRPLVQRSKRAYSRKGREAERERRKLREPEK